MEEHTNRFMPEEKNIHRRDFVRQSLFVAISGVSAVSLLAGCKENDGDEKEVSPPEDLMQEHGLLNRILLIYDHCRTRLENKTDFPMDTLGEAAGIIRTFVEDYHEKQEENYLFPRFRKANRLTSLVDVLLQQHNAGRRITGGIMQLTKNKNTDSDHLKLIQLLSQFNYMYRPHEAREDTVLFPAFRKIVSRHEYDSLGEEFENNEHKLFGEDGFEMTVSKVADIEKRLGIYDLKQFTPAV
jgi:hemerythrin-like domain-containing protein